MLCDAASEARNDAYGYVPLDTPLPIARQAWPEGTRPLVSLCCVTYNHGRFIEQAIESFLMQETTFPVEISIHDDASTDGTADIVRRCQAAYPRLIRAVLQVENQFSRVGNAAIIRFLQSAPGSYVAFCEGDDYWTAANKLEMQVAYLRANPGAAISFHDVTSVDQNGKEISPSKIVALVGSGQPRVLHDYAAQAHSLIPTLSTVYRNVQIGYGPRSRPLVNLDCYRHARLSEFGEAHNLGVTMGAHRRHSGGIWTSLDMAKQRAAIRQYQAAVAWEIAPRCCLDACMVLAETCVDHARSELREKRFSAAVDCLYLFLSSVVICLRAPKTAIPDVVHMLRAMAGIGFVPLRQIADYGARRLRFKRRHDI